MPSPANQAFRMASCVLCFVVVFWGVFSGEGGGQPAVLTTIELFNTI